MFDQAEILLQSEIIFAVEKSAFDQAEILFQTNTIFRKETSF